jgi:phosphomevalonate kinase
MRAFAPGKIVLSGAYSVLDGAPAVVTAVNRYVVAEPDRAPHLVTPEVAAALALYSGEQAPWFDANALRIGNLKLGLGSSAAIVVASLAVLETRTNGSRSEPSLRESILLRAIEAHRRAQGGGSGVDVAAATFGGTLVVRRHEGGLCLESLELPKSLHLAIWFSGREASTRYLIEQVQGFKQRQPLEASRVLSLQAIAAEEAAEALLGGNTKGFIAAVGRQREALEALGHGADAEIVPLEVRHLDEQARRENGVVLPAGAGGGDVCLFFGLAPPSVRLLETALACGQQRLEPIEFEARGLHLETEAPNRVVAVSPNSTHSFGEIHE